MQCETSFEYKVFSAPSLLLVFLCWFPCCFFGFFLLVPWCILVPPVGAFRWCLLLVSLVLQAQRTRNAPTMYTQRTRYAHLIEHIHRNLCMRCQTLLEPDAHLGHRFVVHTPVLVSVLVLVISCW